ncbi:MAG TPA: DUF2911 domain-containing protein [Thermoanaerobaculia bacterium]
MRRITVLSLSVLLLAATVSAQDSAKKPPLSPPAKAEAKIGNANITIDYSAPSMRGRTIMGELVPYGKVWRTGANAATTLKSDTDLMIGNLHVPAGTYSLFTVPGEKEWVLIVSKQTGQWGSGKYDQAQDLGRVPMTVKATDAPVETFKIGVKSKDASSGSITLAWENVKASVPLMVH